MDCDMKKAHLRRPVNRDEHVDSKRTVEGFVAFTTMIVAKVQIVAQRFLSLGDGSVTFVAENALFLHGRSPLLLS